MRVAVWLLGLALMAASASASAVVITRYLPPTVAPGGEVTLIGNGFGSWGDQRWKSLRIGRGPRTYATFGADRIKRWTPTSVTISLPNDLGPGVYWVGIYDKSGRLLSNRTPALRVENRSGLGSR